MVDEEEGNDGLGMAEIIAIVVCGLIIFAFLFACYVVIRNAQKRKKMTAAKGVAKGAKEMSFDKIVDDNGSFVATR